MLKLIDPETPITKDDFDNFEKQLNVILPLKMKELYLSYNGGQPYLPCVHDKNHIFPVNGFFSLEEMKDNLNWFEDESFPDGFNKTELLPFAYFPGNGCFGLSLRKNDYGKIYFYVLEEKATIHGEWDSFDEFLDSFIDDKE